MERIDLLKLDIEGTEAQALRTAPFSLAPSTSLLSFMGIMDLNVSSGISRLTDSWHRKDDHRTPTW
jgi:hypothetical protein